MRLSDIATGTRAIKRVPLPLVNVPSKFSSDVPELLEQREKDRADALANGQPFPDEITVGLRVLLSGELVEVYENAARFAKEHGVSEPNESDPIYNLGVSIYICAMSCVDPDSDPRNPVRFFGRGDLESAAAELLSSPHIGRDGLAYLAEQQELWQDLSNPRANKIPPHKFYDVIVAMANEDANKALKDFLALRPGMLFHLLRSMAVQLVSLLKLKFTPGVTSQETTSSG